MAPITWSLRCSLWPHDVTVWVRSPAQGGVRRRRIPQGRRRSEGYSAPIRYGSLHGDPFPSALRTTGTPRRRWQQVNMTTSRAGLTTKIQRTDMAHSDGQQSKNNNSEVRGRTDRQSMMRRHRQPRSASSPKREGKRGGSIRFDPQESSSATDSTEQDMWSNFRQITTRLTHTRGTPQPRCAAADSAEMSDWPGQPRRALPTLHGWAPAG